MRAKDSVPFGWPRGLSGRRTGESGRQAFITGCDGDPCGLHGRPMSGVAAHAGNVTGPGFLIAFSGGQSFWKSTSAAPLSSLRLIAGLGNPGREYENTRHNAGFMIVDRLAVRLGVTFSRERKFEALLARAGDLLLLKPQTYMNLSGRSVAAVCQFYRIEPAEVLVVYDDVALPEGKLRLRAGGSAGGHNGMRSLIACLGTDQFPRLRFGVGAADGKNLSGHVLGAFDPAGKEALDKSLENAVEAVSMAALRGMAAAMNHFNQPDKPPPKPRAPRQSEGTAENTPTPQHES